MFWKCLSKLSIDFGLLKTFKDHRGYPRGHQVEPATVVDQEAKFPLLSSPRLPDQPDGRGGAQYGL